MFGIAVFYARSCGVNNMLACIVARVVRSPINWADGISDIHTGNTVFFLFFIPAFADNAVISGIPSDLKA